MLFNKNLTVGTNIKSLDITEFYFTESTSTNPPHFQRYLLSYKDGKHYFYHEKREGDHWPLREEDITVSGKKEISEDEWNEFFELLKEGTVTERKENPGTEAGPYLFMYSTKDKGKYQKYKFASYEKQCAFEDLCEKHKSQTK